MPTKDKNQPKYSCNVNLKVINNFINVIPKKGGSDN